MTSATFWHCNKLTLSSLTALFSFSLFIGLWAPTAFADENTPLETNTSTCTSLCIGADFPQTIILNEPFSFTITHNPFTSFEHIEAVARYAGKAWDMDCPIGELHFDAPSTATVTLHSNQVCNTGGSPYADSVEIYFRDVSIVSPAGINGPAIPVDGHETFALRANVDVTPVGGLFSGGTYAHLYIPSFVTFGSQGDVWGASWVGGNFPSHRRGGTLDSESILQIVMVSAIGNEYRIASGLPSSGDKNWIIPPNLPDGTYRFKIGTPEHWFYGDPQQILVVRKRMPTSLAFTQFYQSQQVLRDLFVQMHFVNDSFLPFIINQLDSLRIQLIGPDDDRRVRMSRPLHITRP